MAGANTLHGDDVRIRQLLDEWLKAMHAKDADAVLSHYASDLVTYDLIPPLQHKGAAAYRKVLGAWLAAIDGAVRYELHDVDINVSDSVALVRSVNHIVFRHREGKDVDNWICGTLWLKKKSGAWKIAHQHFSMPFDMKTGKALLDLGP